MSDTDLEALAERVEKLEGPCRETDALIWCALNGKRYQMSYQAYGSQDTMVEFTEPPKRTRRTSGNYGLPHAKQWTGSIDAAMSLMPAGAYWMAGKEHGRPWARCFEIDKVYDMPEGYGEYVEAATPALALVSAALRARALSRLSLSDEVIND